MKVKKLLMLDWKKLLIVIVADFVSIILHNLVSGLLRVEEPFFFITAVLAIPLYILIAIPFTLISLLNKRKGIEE